MTAVCSHFKWFAVTKPTGSPAMVEPTEDGLKVASSFPLDTCWKMETLATKTDVHGFVTEMRVVDGKPDEYGLNHSINTGRNLHHVASQEVVLDLSAEVQAALLADGILPENVLHLPKTRTFYIGAEVLYKTA
uniref:Uncharacterized protein n=1 Tax=Astatotilapia calliptera TaxID=8154 RepID=A0A3P8NZM9_ASTCA